jgi:hypothetical protein
MRNNQNTAIVLLLISASILTAVLIGVWAGSSEPAFAGTTTRDGDFAVATGAFSDQIDVLYMVDISAQQLNAYVVNVNTRAIELRDSVDLERAFR